MIKVKILPKINFFIGLICCLILFPTNIKSLLIIILGIYIIVNSISKKNKFNFGFLFNYGLLYLVIAATILYSSNVSQGFLTLQTMLSLLIFPLYFSLLSKRDYIKININFCMWVFIVSILSFHLIVFLSFYITQFSFQETIIHFQEIITNKLGKFSIHPIYLSMNCCVALIFSFFLLKKNDRFRKRIILHLFQVLLFSFLCLHAKKGPLLAFFIVFVTYLVFFKNKKNIKVLVPVILIFTVFLISVPKIQHRFSEILKIEKLTEENANSTNIRFAIYKNTLKLISKSPFLGYGIGDYNDQLKLIYSDNNQKILLEKNYNSHNQYLSFLLIGGPVVLFVFLYFFFKNIKIAYNKNNQIFVLLLVFYATVMLTENILERESGVIYFSFFLSLFGYRNYYQFEKE